MLRFSEASTLQHKQCHPEMFARRRVTNSVYTTYYHYADRKTGMGRGWGGAMEDLVERKGGSGEVDWIEWLAGV